MDLVLRDRVLDELVGGQREGVLLLARLREGAELALHAADVRLVQVDVLDEEDLVAAAALPAREVGEIAEREQVVGLHERDAVVEVEPLAGEHLLPDRGERVEGVQNGHRGLPLPVDDCVRQGLELVSVQLAVQSGPGLSSVVERHLAGLVERAGRARRARARRPSGRRRARRARRRRAAPRAGGAGSASRRGGRCRRSCRSRSSRPSSRGRRRRSGTRSRARGRTRRSRRRAGTRPRTASRS